MAPDCDEANERSSSAFAPKASRTSQYQRLILFLLQRLQSRGYRRFRGKIFEQIFVANRRVSEDCNAGDADGSPATALRFQNTHAWRPVGGSGDIQTFVLANVTKETQYAHWQALVGGRTLRSVVLYLASCNELEFPELNPSRKWIAFANGVYCTEGCGEFFAWGSAAIPSDMVACNFHNIVFPGVVAAARTAAEVLTPALDSILGPQLVHLAPSERRRVLAWIYALLGRTLYSVNERDQWQVMLTFLGIASTGKSLILKAISRWWRSDDVGVLSSQGRRGDADLEPLLCSKLVVCYELAAGMTLDQAQLQSMVSGEPLTIVRMHRPSITIPWTAPCVFAGNELASWSDHSGSLLRRLLLITFDVKIGDATSDPHLDGKLAAELPAMLHKCCLAYNAVAAAHGSTSLWSAQAADASEDTATLPQYFRDTRARLAEMTHSMASFLRNSDLRLSNGGVGRDNTRSRASETNAQAVIISDDDSDERDHDDFRLTRPPPVVPRTRESLGMPFERFRALANAYCSTNGLTGIVWGKPHTYVSVLQDFGIARGRLGAQHLHWGSRVYDGRVYGLHAEWIHGAAERHVVEATELGK